MALKDLLFSNVDDVKPSDLLILIKSKDDEYLAVKLDTESDTDFTEVLTKLEKVFPKSEGFTTKGVNIDVFKEVASEAEIIDFKDLDENKEYFSEEPVVTTEGDEANSDSEKNSEPETDNGKPETTLHSNMNLEDILFSTDELGETNDLNTLLFSADELCETNDLNTLLFSTDELGETNDLRTLLFDDSETGDDNSDDKPDLVERADEFKDETKPADTTPSSKVKIEVEVPQDPAASNENKALEKVKQIVETFHSSKVDRKYLPASVGPDYKTYNQELDSLYDELESNDPNLFRSNGPGYPSRASEIKSRIEEILSKSGGKFFDSVEVGTTRAEEALNKIAEILAGETAPLGTTTEVVEDPKPEVSTQPASPEVAPEEPSEPASPEVVAEDEEYKSPVELVKEANENKDTDSLELHCRQTNKRKF